MPVYTYAVINADGSDGEVFEVEHSADRPPLERHPESGKPVRRVYESANFNTQYTPGREKSLSDISKIRKAGFEILERDKLTGRYHKK